MYVTQFTTTGGETQGYYYHTIAHAMTHLSYFVDDDSGLYKDIKVIDDENGETLCMIPFVDGKAQFIVTADEMEEK